MNYTLCVDGLFLGRNYLGSGINRYCASILANIQDATADTELRTRVLVESLDSVEQNGLARQRGVEFVASTWMRRTRIWHRVGLMEMARRLKADVVFMPSPGRVYLKRRKLVVTVH